MRPIRSSRRSSRELRGKGAAKSKRSPTARCSSSIAKAPMQDARVPLLREKLGVAGEASDLDYDAKLAEAVKKFQQANRAAGHRQSRCARPSRSSTARRAAGRSISSSPTWSAGAGIRAISAPPMSSSTSPDFTLKVMHNGAAGLDHASRDRQARSKQTPLLSETMKSITINPTWNVPPSIVYNEYLPALAQDPTVLARMGLKVVLQSRRQRAHLAAAGRGQRARAASASTSPTASWSISTTRTDKHHVRARRARLQPRLHARARIRPKYAEVLSQHRAAERALDGREDQADVRHRRAGHPAAAAPIWVHLTYQSAFVDDNGKLQVRRDIYNLDSRTHAAIKSERAMVEPAQERKRDRRSPRRAQRRSAAQPTAAHVSFFESLFGGGQPPQATGRCRRAASRADRRIRSNGRRDATAFGAVRVSTHVNGLHCCICGSNCGKFSP